MICSDNLMNTVAADDGNDITTDQATVGVILKQL